MNFQDYQQFVGALFQPEDVTALALISADNSNNVQHSFMPASQLATQTTYDALMKLDQTFNIYLAMNPFKSEMVGQKTGRTKKNVAAVKRVYVDVDKDGAQILVKMGRAAQLRTAPFLSWLSVVQRIVSCSSIRTLM
jgi:hypothetical protein